MTTQTSQNPISAGSFDWYQATTFVGVDEFQRRLMPHYDLANWQPMRGMHNYPNGAQLLRGDIVLCNALWGGKNGENVHAWASGYEAIQFSKVIRQAIPEHSVTRLDVAIDFIEPNSWNEIENISFHVADKHRLKVQHIGDFHRQLDGRTLNIGGVKSDCRVTCYEKGKQLGENPDWVRAEIKVRPPKAKSWQTHLLSHRMVMARMDPMNVWGASKWSSYMAEQLTGRIVPSFAMRTWRESNTDRAFNAMCKQYKNVLIAKAKQAGGAAELGEEIIKQVFGCEI